MLRSPLHRIRRHLGANLVGYVALFAALGGSAGAAAIITSNSQVGPGVIAGAKGPAGSTDNVIAGSIGTADLASSTVTGSNLANNSVTSAKIADGQVSTADLANGAVSSAKLAAGSVGSANLANGAVGAGALGSDVQAPLNLSLTPGFANAAPAGGTTIGGATFSFSCSRFDEADPLLHVSAFSNEPSELDVASLEQPVGGAPLQPSLQSASSPAYGGVLLDLFRDTQAQTTIVWHDADETVTGTLSIVTDPSHCEIHGQLDRAVK